MTTYAHVGQRRYFAGALCICTTDNDTQHTEAIFPYLHEVKAQFQRIVGSAKVAVFWG